MITHDTRLRPTKCGPAAGYPVVRVVQAFQPEIWDDTQVSVVKGDLFLRLWQQPTEDALAHCHAGMIRWRVLKRQPGSEKTT